MLFGRRKDVANKRWRLSAKLLIASSVATVIGFSAICASVMLDMTREALRAFQVSAGLPADGFATSEVLDRLRGR